MRKEVLCSPILSPKEAYTVRKHLSQGSMVSFPRQQPDHTAIAVVHVTEIVIAGVTSQSFLINSLLCFLQMMLFNIDSFTFSSPDKIPLINLFLRGKAFSLTCTGVNQ
jgi:hypothetical protein